MSFWKGKRSEALINKGDFDLINSSREFQKEMNALWSNIRKNVSDEELPSSFVMCSASEGEGCTTITLGLGIFVSKHSNRRVVVVDTQKESLYMSEFLSEYCPELSNEEEVTSANIGFREFSLTKRNLSFLQIINPENLNFSPESESSFDTFLMFLRNSYDYIFFDCAPILTSPISNFLANKLDYVIFVVSVTRSSQRKLIAAINEVSCDKERLLGVVMNKRRNILPDFINKLIG
ncbi:MAG: AAA family ATPase [Syntrophaceae bacterium]|nr:AAA family ATPase [Syntrophaceae bacterium]